MCYLENTINRYKQKGIAALTTFVLLCVTSLRSYPILGKHSWYHMKRKLHRPYSQRIGRSGMGKAHPRCPPSGPSNPSPTHSWLPASLPVHPCALTSVLRCDKIRLPQPPARFPSCLCFRVCSLAQHIPGQSCLSWLP